MNGLGLGLTIGGPPGAAAFYDVVEALGDDLLACWDAERADLITQADGLVSLWTDAKHGYALAQETAANQPAYSATGCNGRPCIAGDGVTQFMTLEGAPFPSETTPVEIWAVATQAAPVVDTAVRVLFGYGGNAAGKQLSLRRSVMTGMNQARAATKATNRNNVYVPFDGPHLVRGRFHPTSVQCDVDGIEGEGGEVTLDSIGTTRVRLFASTSDTPAAFWIGGANLILVTNPLTDGNAVPLAAALMISRL
jgi:hypothetical protein